MGFTDNLGAALGGEGLLNTAQAVGKGDMKGAWEANKNNVYDVTTLGLSKGARDKKKAEEEAAAKMQEQSNALGVEVDASLKRQGVMQDEYKKRRDAGLADMDRSDLSYEQRVRGLTDEAKRSATDANIVHTNMSGKYSTMQEEADNEVKSAMSLAEYQNPNNRVANSTRNIYNDEGDRLQGDYNAEGDRLRGQYNDEGERQQGMFEKNAGGETRRGQADFGVLSSLGAQSVGNAGMGPMTVGQQMAMMAQSQRQAGEAYAGAQRRVQALRDQGLQANTMNRDRGLEQASSTRGRGLDAKTSTRARGIESGFERADAAFAAGEGARDRQGRIMDSRRGLENDYRTFQQGNRGEREGFSQNLNASESGRGNRKVKVASDNRGIGFQQEAARMAETMRRNGASESAIQVKLQQAAAEQAEYAKMIGTGVSTAGTVVGGIYGGPAGAAAGSKMGGFVPGQDPGPQGAAAAPPRTNASMTFSTANNPDMGQTLTHWNQLGERGPNPAPRGQPVGAAQQNGGAFGSYMTRKYGGGRSGQQES